MPQHHPTAVYATDIHGTSLERAEAGVYPVDRVQIFTENHGRAGGKCSLSEYYTAAYGNAVFDRSLRKHISFSDHSLATDSAFAEVQLVSCRNVLIYFNRELQNRAVGVLSDALCNCGFLGIGAKESLRFTRHYHRFRELSCEPRIYPIREEQTEMFPKSDKTGE
jgi:chemotaxis protein methyltransferase CheR